MDDVSLGGPLSTVSSDVDLIRIEGAKIALQLNFGKCEVISKAPFNPEGSLAGFSTLRPADAFLLGAPLIGRRSRPRSQVFTASHTLVTNRLMH